MHQEGWHQASRRGRPYKTRIWTAGGPRNGAQARANAWTRLSSGSTRAGDTRRKSVSVYVFTGPTISPREAESELDAVYLPPAAEGDVHRVSLKQPQAIGIIDGYFQSMPTVRHKEILWDISHGIHLFVSVSIDEFRAEAIAAYG